MLKQDNGESSGADLACGYFKLNECSLCSLDTTCMYTGLPLDKNTMFSKIQMPLQYVLNINTSLFEQKTCFVRKGH